MIRTRLAAVLSLAAVVAVVPANPGLATTTFNFFGSGFGHGVGMSQWGAYGLALKGWTGDRILRHYYSGTTVGRSASVPGRVRVGLVAGVGSLHVTAVGGRVTFTTRPPGSDGRVVAAIPGGSTYLVKGGSGNYVILDGAGKRVVSPVDGGKKLYLDYRKAGAMVRSPEAGHTYNRGFIELDDYRPCAACTGRLRAIAVLSMQAYLYGLGEVPASWPMQAMEAQAGAARTYAAYVVAALGQTRPGCNCGLYDDTRNQVYAGWDHEGEADAGRWVRAVDDTAGQVVLYNGKPINAVYMSSSGGYTENSNDVWGGSPVPYLRGVCDPGDFTNANPARVWKVSLSGTATTSRLRPYTGDIGAVRRFKNFTRGVSGRLLSVTVVGGTGSRTITGAALRGALGLMDDRVWVNSDRNVTGTIRSRYDALRCAPGLPRSPRVHVLGGARQRFARGAIYRNAQADRTVWLFGAIYSEYRRVKEARGPLGLPVAGVKRLVKPADCDRRTCRKARFDRGVVFLKRDVGAHELHGAVLAYFSSHGAIGGHLGFPMSDVVSLSNGGSQATFQGKPGGSPVIVTCGPHGWCSESTPS